jgi:hypothetical protein
VGSSLFSVPAIGAGILDETNEAENARRFAYMCWAVIHLSCPARLPRPAGQDRRADAPEGRWIPWHGP